MRKLIVLLMVVTLLLSGCYVASNNVLRSNYNDQLCETDSIAVLVPRNGRYGGKIYQDSGAIVASKIRESLLNSYREIETLNVGTVENALPKCKSAQIRYLVVPRIIHWEDRATNWSGVADKVKIELAVVDTANGKTVKRLMFKANSSFYTLVNNPPEQLLDGSFDEVVRDLTYRY